jgi:hypothetical protein
MSALQKILVKMAEEYRRLDDFVEKIRREGLPSNEEAALETKTIVILTKNHGYFVLDQDDIFGILERRRDSYAKDLKDRTWLGEDISRLRPQPTE